MSSVKDRLTKVSRLFLRPSGSHNVQPEPIQDPQKIAGFCRQETATTLKARKIVEDVMKVNEHRNNLAQEADATAGPKLVANREDFKHRIQSHLRKKANYRMYNPSNPIRKNRTIKPVCESYEQQSRDRQLVTKERRSGEHRQDQFNFRDEYEETSRSRPTSSDGRARSKKTKYQRSASEEIQKENRRRTVSAPEKIPARKEKIRDNSPHLKKNAGENKEETMEQKIDRLEKEVKVMKENQKNIAAAAARKSREKRRKVSVGSSDEEQTKKKKRMKSSENKKNRKRPQQEFNESSDSDTESVVQKKKVSETRAKLRDKTLLSPEKIIRKEKLEELKLARRKSIERRLSQRDEVSSCEEEPEQTARPVSPPQQSESSGEEQEAPEETAQPQSQIQQSENSSESEESEIEQACEVNDDLPAVEPEDVYQLSSQSPADKKPDVVKILATIPRSRIPIILDDPKLESISKTLTKIGEGEEPGNIIEVAPIITEKDQEIPLIDLDDDEEEEDPVLKLDKMMSKFQQYLNLEHQRSMIITHKYRKPILLFDDALPSGSNVADYKLLMMKTHLEDNVQPGVKECVLQ